jgi:hypothetical protein
MLGLLMAGMYGETQLLNDLMKCIATAVPFSESAESHAPRMK